MHPPPPLLLGILIENIYSNILGSGWLIKCHMSYVKYHISHVNKYYFFFKQSVGTWWGVCYECGLPRDAKKYKHANNVGVKNPIWGRILAKDYVVLLGKWVMAQFLAFWWHFFCTFWNFMLVVGIFLHYLGLLGLLRCFVGN